jgi:ABC transport system ATP-binding/permease protein
MSLVLLNKIELQYNTKTILENITLQIDNKSKIGIIGNNRSGKSSLLKMISGDLLPDSGDVIVSKGVRIKLINQELSRLDINFNDYLKLDNKDIFDLIEEYNNFPTQLLFDKLTSLNAFEYELRLNELKKEFELHVSNPLLSTLSGGQVKKVQLISGILFNTDLILLDEPTNHLDIEGIVILESILKKYNFLVVSHDRKFLDNICNEYIEIWDKKLYKHHGNYNQFLESKSARLDNESIEAWKLNQYLKRELAWVSAGVKARGTKDKGRLQRFEEKQSLEKKPINLKVDIVLPQTMHNGTRILELENFNLLKNNVKVLGPLNFKVEKEFKIGIIGPNGTYKSTFIKTILGQSDKAFTYNGTAKIGINTKFLYFEQDKSSLNENETVFNYLGEGKERLEIGNSESIGIYKYLENWLFFKDQYNTQIKNLSGGEKSKLALAKKLLEPTNFLILDEPTNDLDLDTILLLQTNLVEYTSPCMIISHDRDLLNHVCNVILAFNIDGSITISYGNYDDYYKKYKSINNDIVNIDITKPKNNQKDLRRLEATKRDIEKQINQLSTRIKKIDDELIKPEIFSDYIKTNNLITKKEELNCLLDKLETEFLVILENGVEKG